MATVDIDKVSNHMVDDIFCTALEGGLTYWATDAYIEGNWPENAHYLSDVLTKGGKVRLRVYQAPSVVVTLANMRKGIRKAAKHYNMSVARFYDEHDADMADNAVQYAVFGELVYA